MTSGSGVHPFIVADSVTVPGISEVPVVPEIKASGETPAVIQLAGGQPVAAVMSGTFFAKAVVVGNRIVLSLPAGKPAICVVERAEVDAEGRWVMSEGRIIDPAEGRFMFRRQPEGTPSGRYVGAIRFPYEKYGYLLGESTAGAGPTHLKIQETQEICVIP